MSSKTNPCEWSMRFRWPLTLMLSETTLWHSKCCQKPERRRTCLPSRSATPWCCFRWARWFWLIFIVKLSNGNDDVKNAKNSHNGVTTEHGYIKPHMVMIMVTGEDDAKGTYLILNLLGALKSLIVQAFLEMVCGEVCVILKFWRRKNLDADHHFLFFCTISWQKYLCRSTLLIGWPCTTGCMSIV